MTRREQIARIIKREACVLACDKCAQQAADQIIALDAVPGEDEVEEGAKAVEAAGACIPAKWLQDDAVYYRRFARAALTAAAKVRK